MCQKNVTTTTTTTTTTDATIIPAWTQLIVTLCYNNLVSIDATGRLGPDAKAFLFKTCGTETFRRSKFLKKVSITCARAVGKILNSSRVRLVLPQNGAA